MSEPLRNALDLLDEKQTDFIKSEFSCSEEELLAMNEDELYEIYEALCDIEIGDDFEKAETASDIVTILGNEIAKDEGMLDEDEFENGFND